MELEYTFRIEIGSTYNNQGVIYLLDDEEMDIVLA